MLPFTPQNVQLDFDFVSLVFKPLQQTCADTWLEEPSGVLQREELRTAACTYCQVAFKSLEKVKLNRR